MLFLIGFISILFGVLIGILFVGQKKNLTKLSHTIGWGKRKLSLQISLPLICLVLAAASYDQLDFGTWHFGLWNLALSHILSAIAMVMALIYIFFLNIQATNR